MVKSKSEETKEYKILLETRVPFHPQERVCSSVLLPDRLTVTSGVHIFGSTAQGLSSQAAFASPLVLLSPRSHPATTSCTFTWPLGSPFSSPNLQEPVLWFQLAEGCQLGLNQHQS